MEIPFDILDYTFGFLISDPESLARCSEAHPVFSRMVEKYQYYHIIICTGETRGNLLEPSYFIKLLSDKPRITTYVRVLQVEFYYRGLRRPTPYLEQIAAILPMFPVLECLLLSTPHKEVSWQDFPDIFRKAVEGCLRLPTLQEVHVCCSDFPLSMLDNHANIDCFSFSGTPQFSEFGDATYPHLRTLSVENFHYQQSDQTIFSAWAIQHIVKLQSLKYDYSSDEEISELFKSCSNTLNNLDLSFSGVKRSEFATIYQFRNRHLEPRSHTQTPVDLSSLPHLQHLTIRAAIYFDRIYTNEICISFLPAAMEILKTASSLQQVTIEINVDLSTGYVDCDDFVTNCDVDYSPLTTLAQSSVSFHHIDLHFNSGEWDFTHTEIVSLLAKHGGLTELIEQGVLVVHLDTAPTFLDMVSKRTVQDIYQRSIVQPFAFYPAY